jgi:hypothetical protein
LASAIDAIAINDWITFVAKPIMDAMKTTLLIALGLALVGTATWAMSDTHAAALNTAPAATVVAPPVAAAAGNTTILPYGAMDHDAAASVAAILPYGAMTTDASNTAEAIPPYGVMHHVAADESATVLPYGAVGPRAAP